MKGIFKYVLVGVASALVTHLTINWSEKKGPEVELTPNPKGAARLVGLEEKNIHFNQSPEYKVKLSVPDFSWTVEEVRKSVVAVDAYDFEDLRISSGSGVIYSRNGYILTNNHVVQGGNTFKITLSNKRSFQARLVGTDFTTDLALLKAVENDLQPVDFGNSDNVKVGQWVLAVGNPFDLPSTVTAGIVSAKWRDLDLIPSTFAIESFIQTDAVVNVGNSGGALVDAGGRLIGINTAILTESGGYEGYSFAAPSNLVQKVAQDLRLFGTVQRGILGVELIDLEEEVAKENGLFKIEGAVIQSVTPGSSAYVAGLQPEDIVIALNDTPIESAPQFQELLARLNPGDSIDLTYYRERNKRMQKGIVLQSSTDLELKQQNYFVH